MTNKEIFEELKKYKFETNNRDIEKHSISSYEINCEDYNIFININDMGKGYESYLCIYFNNEAITLLYKTFITLEEAQEYFNELKELNNINKIKDAI